MLNMDYLWIYSSSAVLFISLSFGQDCRLPLGMRNKTMIPDEYLSATSSHAPSTGPQFARLHGHDGDGAWCPKDVVEPGTQHKYLQIQLPYASFITRIATQGRYGGGYGREYVRNYKVNYSRDGVSWFGWSNHKGVNILQGNEDVRSVRMQSFYPAITGAKFLRIIPVTTSLMPVCLRLELYGCPWKSGLLSYSIPTPDHPPSALHMFSDDTYDGTKSSTIFSGGLGQLVDRIIGSGDVTKTISRYPTNTSGYDYVGWSQKRGKKITMEFRFDQVRNFTSLRVYCNTNKAVGASIFSSIKILSSLNGRDYKNIENRFMSQSSLSYFTTRVTYIPLHNKLARGLKLEVELGRGRLLISEIKFNNRLLSPELISRISSQNPWMGEEVKIALNPVSGSPSNPYVSIIAGILGGIIFILLLLAFALYFKQRKLHKPLSSSSSFTFRSAPRTCSDTITLTPRLPPPPHNAPPLKTKHSSAIYHEISFNSATAYLEPIRTTKKSPPPPYQATTEPSTCDHLSCRKPLKASHYAEANVFLSNLSDQVLQGVSGNNIYSVPCITPSPKSPLRSPVRTTRQALPNLHGTCINADNISGSEEQSALLASFGIRPSDLPPEFPREKLQFVEKLGQGQFGEVQLCLADTSIRKLCDDEWFSLPGNSRGKLLVAVKVLHEDASESAKENFFQEVRVMSRLLHGNIVRLLAVCTEAEPFAMVTEYMERGDLHQYLQTFSDDLHPSPGKNVIRSDVLLKIVVQIAAGMQYLSSLSFVHRDLAARNCLVGSGNEIRIGDFGMSRNMYQSDYYRIQGKVVLPIRWMSWECVLMGLFSASSDVWSFGVTVWEVYSLCKHQPLAALSDQQVIENMHHVFRKTGQEVFLPRPKRCPGSLFNAIRKCWRRDAAERPNFQQLYSYLQERVRNYRVSPKPPRPKEKPPKPKVRTVKPIV